MSNVVLLLLLALPVVALPLLPFLLPLPFTVALPELAFWLVEFETSTLVLFVTLDVLTTVVDLPP